MCRETIVIIPEEKNNSEFDGVLLDGKYYSSMHADCAGYFFWSFVEAVMVL